MSDFVITHETVKIQWEEKQKHIFFHFKIFETFGNLEIGFSINLSECLLTAFKFSSYTDFWLIFRNTM